MNNLQRLIAISERKVHAPIIRQVNGLWTCSFFVRVGANGAMRPYLTKGFATQLEAYNAARDAWREAERTSAQQAYERRYRNPTIA